MTLVGAQHKKEKRLDKLDPGVANKLDVIALCQMILSPAAQTLIWILEKEVNR
jgi:hypothetical protein